MERRAPGRPDMADIAVMIVGDAHSGDRYCVSIAGRLSGRDLRRLERACGKAMEQRTPPLEIRVAYQAELDATVRFFLESLRVRGATIVGLEEPPDQ